jgi:hypothetical protein
MENFEYHVPFYLVNGGIATSGHSSELKGTALGLFDRATFSVTTALGNGKELFFAQGTLGGKTWFGTPVTQTSHKSPFFYAKDVENMYKSLPHRIINEEWVLGYNGGPSSIGLSYTKGVPVRVKFLFTGDPTYRFYGGPKEFLVSHTPQEDCSQPCEGNDCPDTIADCLTETQKLVDKINTDEGLRRFGVQAKIVTSDYSETATNMTKWCLTLCDNGDGVALKAVEAQAPVGVVVTRTARSGSESTYQFCQSDEADAPVDFTQTGSVLQAVCDECPADSFLIESKTVYIVKRPIVGGEDFSTVASRDAYANTVWSAYATQESVTTSTSTSTSTTAAGSYNSDATFVGQDGAVAIVKLKFPEGTVLDPAIGADIIGDSWVEAAQCVFDAPAAVAWEDCGSGISSRRTMKIKCLNRPDCAPDGDRLDDLIAILSGVQGIDIDSLTKIAGDSCCDDYTVEQDSVDCLDEACLTSNVTFTYDTLPAFENKSWELVPEAVVEDETRKCGIRISAGYYDPKFGNCSFQIGDFYQTQPVKFEVSLLGEDDSACDFASKPSQQQTKVGQHSRQSGEYVVRELIMKTDAYLKHIKQYSADPRMREAFDMNLLDMADRNAFYDLYYVTFKASYGHSFRKNEQETFTAVFAFKEGDGNEASFEANILDVLTAKSGVVMHIDE